MAEEEKSKPLVQMSTVVASGITAIVAALFTSRLGVAGTLIGTAMTPMLMTIGVAILNAQIEKATSRVSELPSTVRGRLTTQRVRVPGTPSPEAPPGDPDPPVSRRRDRRAPGILQRLLSIPTYLREMSPSTRRRTLLTGALAGLVAAGIGLAGVTGLEAASGGTLSCTLYEECSNTSSGDETAQTGTSLSRAFEGPDDTGTQGAPVDSEGPADVQRPGDQPAPGVDEVPQNGQYEGGPQNGNGQAPSGGEPQESPVDPEQPAADGEPDTPAQDGSQQPEEPADDGEPATPSEQQR